MKIQPVGTVSTLQGVIRNRANTTALKETNIKANEALIGRSNNNALVRTRTVVNRNGRGYVLTILIGNRISPRNIIVTRAVACNILSGQLSRRHQRRHVFRILKRVRHHGRTILTGTNLLGNGMTLNLYGLTQSQGGQSQIIRHNAVRQ